MSLWVDNVLARVGVSTKVPIKCCCCGFGEKRFSYLLRCKRDENPIVGLDWTFPPFMES